MRPLPRSVLPIPDVAYAGPTMYDARDPDAQYQPIEPLRPPEGAPDVIPAWNDIPDDLEPVLAREMELYAAFLEHTDWCIRPGGGRDRSARRARRHADLGHRRRQRRFRRGGALQRSTARRPQRRAGRTQPLPFASDEPLDSGHVGIHRRSGLGGDRDPRGRPRLRRGDHERGTAEGGARQGVAEMGGGARRRAEHRGALGRAWFVVLSGKMESAAPAFIGKRGRRRSGELVRPCSPVPSPSRSSRSSHSGSGAQAWDRCPMAERWGRRTKPQAAGAVRAARPNIGVPGTSERGCSPRERVLVNRPVLDDDG